MPGKLSLDDIVDLRAYERERGELRARVIAMKRWRRVHVGPIVTLVFENRETIRFQIQEMARAERILDDARIQAELDVYNPLIPDPGQLSATLFVELTSPGELREWLPKLVGIERSVVLHVGDQAIECQPEEAHAAQLTREETTAAVHYVRFDLTPAQVGLFAAEPLVLAVDHPSYQASTKLSQRTRKSLLGDLKGAEDGGAGRAETTGRHPS